MKIKTAVTAAIYVAILIILCTILISEVISTLNGIKRQTDDVLHKFTAWVSLKAFEYNATDKAFESGLFEFSDTYDHYFYNELTPIAEACFNTTMKECESDSIRYIYHDRAAGRIFSYSDSISFADENPIFTYFAYLIMTYNPFPVDEEAKLPNIPVLESKDNFKTTMTQYIIEDAVAGRYIFTKFLNEKTELCYNNAVSSYRHFRNKFLTELSFRTIVTNYYPNKTNIRLLLDYYFKKSSRETCEVRYLTLGQQEGIYSNCILKYELMPVYNSTTRYDSKIYIESNSIVEL